MARKKTVSISRKPSTGDSPEAVLSTPPPTLPSSLEPPGASLSAMAATLPVASAPSLGPVGRVVYGTVFCLSYGVVFGAILLGQFIPGSGLVGQAMLDGAGSARRSFGRKGGCEHAKAAGVAV